MANSTKGTQRKTTPKSGPVITEHITEKENPAVEAQIEEKIVAKDIDPEQYVTVRNGFQGKLVYKSSRTGELFVWSNFGDEQELTLRELKNAKNSSKGFFINNWFMFDQDWIIDYLGVGQYYKHALKLDSFDEVFRESPDNIAEIVGNLSGGQKKAVMYRAQELIRNGEIDSRKVIAALEDALGADLIEK